MLRLNQLTFSRAAVDPSERHARDKQTFGTLINQDLPNYSRNYDVRFFVFVIFRPMWIFFLIIGIFISSYMIILHLMRMDEEYNLTHTMLYYLFEFHFFIDFFFGLLHRVWRDLHRIKAYTPRSIFESLLRFITIFPYYEVYLVINHPNIILRYYFRIKVIFRYIIVIRQFIKPKVYIPRRIYLALLPKKYVLVLLLIFLLYTNFWFIVFQCWPEMTEDFRIDMDFDNEHPGSWFSFCLLFCCYCITQNLNYPWWPRFIPEAIAVLMMILSGFYSITMPLFKHILSFTTHHERFYTALGKEQDQVNWFLRRWDCSPALMKKVKNHYMLQWRRTQGSDFRTKFFTNLPETIQKDITLDIFWDTLRHSHLFRDIATLTKRQLSSVMKEIFLPDGEYLYRRGEIKSKMYYIVNGDVQMIKSEVVTMTFTSGSCLGEVSCVLLMPSKVDMICASDCTIHVLDFVHMHMVMGNYCLSRLCMATIKERIARARTLRKFKKRIIGETLRKVDHIQQFRRHWKLVEDLVISNDTSKIYDMLVKDVNGRFSHKYLDLYVLNEEMDLQRDAICINRRFPFVIDPDSTLREFMYWLYLIAVGLNLILVPYFLAVYQGYPGRLYVLFFFLDLIYWIELYLRTAIFIRHNQYNVKKQMVIIKMNFKQPDYICLIFAALPLNYALMLTSFQVYTALARLNRLLVFYKLVYIFRRWKEVSIRCTITKYLKFLSISMINAHIIACTLTFFSGEQTSHNLYVFKFYTAFSSLMRIQCHYRQFEWVLGHLFHVAMFICGFLFLISIMCEVTSSEMYIKVMALQTSKNKNSEIALGNTDRMRNFPVTLRQETAGIKVRQMLINLEFFRCFEPSMLDCFMNLCISAWFVPNTMLVQRTMWSDYMFIIVKGVCEIKTDLHGNHVNNDYILTTQDIIGFMEGLMNIPSLATVVTITDVEVILVDTSKFRNLMITFGMSYITNDFFNTTVQDLEQYRSRNYSSVSTIAIHPLTTHEQAQHIHKKRSMRLSSRLSIQSFTRKKMINIFHVIPTINPAGKFFLYWEIIKCIVFFIQLFIIYFGFNLLFPYTETLMIHQIILDIYGVADMLIRSHLQYYNQYGALVTDGQKTFIHYCKTSLIPDAWSIFPCHVLKLDKILFAKERYYLGYHYHILFSRTVQVYRLNGFILYWQRTEFISKSRVFSIIVKLLQLFLYYFMINVFYVCLLGHRLCDIDEVTFEFDCNKSKGIQWYHLVANIENELLSIEQLVSMLNFQVLSMFCGQSTPILFIFNNNDSALLTLFAVIITVYWIYACSEIILMMVPMIPAYHSLMDYSTVDILDLFSNTEYIDTDLIQRVIDEKQYQFIKKKEQHIRLLDYVPWLNRLELTIKDLPFYIDTLMNVTYFDADPIFCKRIIAKCKLIHAMKDSIIIQNNEVQDKFYVVHQGCVLIKVADECIATLHPGGTFGSVQQAGLFRHTITAVATENSILLVFETRMFGRIIKEYPTVERKFKLARLQYMQFQTPIKDVVKIKKSAARFERWRILATKQMAFLRRGWFYFHFVPLTLSIIMKLIVMINYMPHIETLTYAIFYTLDILVFIRIIVDIISYDSSRPQIFKKCSFWSDLLSIIPIEFALRLFLRVPLIHLAIWNRLLRVSNLIQHYNEQNLMVSRNRFLSVIFLCHLSVLYVLFVAMTWLLVGVCRRSEDKLLCPYYNMGNNTGVVMYADTWAEVESLSMLFGVNLLVRGTFIRIGPVGYRDLWYYTLMYISSTWCTLTIYSTFIGLFYRQYHGHAWYFSQIDDLLNQLKLRQVSPEMLKKSTRHFEAQWVHNRGELIPEPIASAPNYLSETIREVSYTRCIPKHNFFIDTHLDFLRQLYRHADRWLLIPTQKIAHQDDVDMSMYIIRSGEVEGQIVVDSQTTRFLLKKDEAFGELCGLYGEPHVATYSCITRVELLVLKYDKWIYLLDWFPASREVLYESADRLRMVITLNLLRLL